MEVTDKGPNQELRWSLGSHCSGSETFDLAERQASLGRQEVMVLDSWVGRTSFPLGRMAS